MAKKPLKPKRRPPGPPKPPLFRPVSMRSVDNTPTGRELRDGGMARALEGNEVFHAGIHAVAEHLKPGWIGIFEDIRQMYEAAGGPPPRKSGAWGGAANSLIKAGLLQRLPRDPEQSKIDSNHARSAMVYIRL